MNASVSILKHQLNLHDHDKLGPAVQKLEKKYLKICDMVNYLKSQGEDISEFNLLMLNLNDVFNQNKITEANAFAKTGNYMKLFKIYAVGTSLLEHMHQKEQNNLKDRFHKCMSKNIDKHLKGFTKK